MFRVLYGVVTYLLILLPWYISFHFPYLPQTHLENAAAVHVHEAVGKTSTYGEA
jgi:hypothetical protein